MSTILSTLKGLTEGRARRARAEQLWSQQLQSVLFLVTLALLFWMAHKYFETTKFLTEHALVIVVGPDGVARTVRADELSSRPSEREMNAVAFKVVELIQGAGSEDVDTRFAYAKQMMHVNEADLFDQGLGSPETRGEIRKANIYRKVQVDVQKGGVRQLTASDFGAGLAPPDQILERYDRLVTGKVLTINRDNPGVFSESRFAWWVRLMEIPERLEEWPNALVVLRMIELKPIAESDKEKQP